MKNITKSLIALFAIVALSCSVEDVQDRPVVEGIDSPILTAPTDGAGYVLSPEFADNQVERFTWMSANYGGAVEIKYTVEMDVKGNDFKTAQELASVNSENQTSVSVAKMNGAALALGAEPFVPSDFEVRVTSNVGGSDVMSSNVVAIVVTPYTTETPKLWIPGGYQTASGYDSDWTPASAPNLMAEGYGKTAFEGYVYFENASEFLLTPATNFDNKYTKGAADGQLLFNGNDNLSVASAGYYLMKADTDAAKLTYSLTATSWGVIGSATSATTGGDGWGNDADMTYDKTTKLWSVTLDLSANEIKFRANDAWTIDLGQSKTGENGQLAYGGDSNNIVIPSAGNYTITMDLSSPRNYKYTITKN